MTRGPPLALIRKAAGRDRGIQVTRENRHVASAASRTVRVPHTCHMNRLLTLNGSHSRGIETLPDLCIRRSQRA